MLSPVRFGAIGQIRKITVRDADTKADIIARLEPLVLDELVQSATDTPSREEADKGWKDRLYLPTFNQGAFVVWNSPKGRHADEHMDLVASFSDAFDDEGTGDTPGGFDFDGFSEQLPHLNQQFIARHRQAGTPILPLELELEVYPSNTPPETGGFAVAKRRFTTGGVMVGDFREP